MVHQLSAGSVVNSHSLACRSCGQVGLNEIVDLGTTPLANSLLGETQLNQAEPAWPLVLVWCPSCSLAQITETVPPESMFREYAYFSSCSDTMVAHARTLAERLVPARRLDSGSLVVEIASNDGYLLQWYQQQQVPVLGIEPARNIARVAIEQRGVPTISEFFGVQLATELAAEGKLADVIHANNVLAHVPDLNGVVAGFKQMLKPTGTVVVEAPYLRDLLDHVEFDTIYHEHLCYFSLTALNHLFARHGLEIVNVERLQIHGGSLRIFACHQGAETVSSATKDLLREESAWVQSEAAYAGFGQQVEQLGQRLKTLLHDLKQQGKRIAVYGASAKGSTLLNCFGISASDVDYVVDRSPVKQGRYTPGTRLKIHDPEYLLEDQPDYCLLLTWNFAEEVLAQQEQYRRQGGKFIIPIPDVRVA